MINLSMAEPDNLLRPRIAVMGVGGAGGNAINNMIHSELAGCDFIAANTDAQALAMSMAPHKIQLGVNLSRGLGAGSKPEIGRAAAEEQLTDIAAFLEGADMLFITAGMGGGTGTGAAPVIARAAKEAGILTVGVVTKPFHFEGTNRLRQAEMGIADLQQYVDTLIVIPNQNLFRIANERTTFAEAFKMADEVLHSGVRGITDLMVMPGFMNLDFADVKTVMQEMGKAMMGTGEADGDNRAIRAAEAAISNPLLDDISMKGARGVLINITGGMDMTLFEVDQAANRIREEVDPEAQIKVGSTLGENLDGKIRVSVIATGIDVSLCEKPKAFSQTTATQTARPAQTQATVKTASSQSPYRDAPKKIEAVQSLTTEPPFQAPRAVMEPQKQSVSTQISIGTSSYFTMPQVIVPQTTPQTIGATSATQNEEEETAPTAPIEETPPMSVAARQAEMLLATQAAAAPRAYKPTVASVPVQPSIRKPVETRSEGAEKANIRLTQLTTPAPTAPAAAPTVSRSQSLFQRITGFGLVRPSVQDDLDAEDPKEAPIKVQSERIPASREQDDLLDIPAFLRRQTNH